MHDETHFKMHDFGQLFLFSFNKFSYYLINMKYTTQTFRKLTEHTGYFAASTNTGIAWNDSDIYVIDTGECDSDGEQIFDALKKIYPNKKIKAIINTHSHFDHTGGNKTLQKASGCQIWTTGTEGAILEHPELSQEAKWKEHIFHEFNKNISIISEPAKVDKIIDGQKISASDITLQSIILRGHSYGQQGILITENKTNKSVMFAGDALFGKELITKYWIPFMMDEQEFRNSLEIIGRTEASFYIPGHGSVCPKEKIQALIEINTLATLETENFILKQLHKKSATSEEIVKSAADFCGLHLKLSQYLLMKNTINSYLQRMYKNSMIKCKIINNQLVWTEAQKDAL